MSDQEIYRILKLLEEKKISLNQARLLIEIAINNKITKNRTVDIFI